MSTHNIGFYEDLTQITFELSSNTHLISSAVVRVKLGLKPKVICCIIALIIFIYSNEPRHEKTNILVSDQVRHKPRCTVIEDG